MTTRKDNLTTNTQHFEILDGLRGIAAVAVVIFHFMEIVFPDPPANIIAHGFLAVDFFFCLSGFVIAYAYGNRIGEMHIKDFFKARLIRLHPLVVLGSLIGLLGLLIHPLGAGPDNYSAGYIIILFLASILMIPFPFMPERYNNLFNLNAPSWSLFWEYVANILYATVLYKLARRYLLWLAIIAAVGLTILCYVRGSLLGGWGGTTFWDGGVRLAFSFTAGMVVYRYRIIIPNKLGFPGLALML
ncbi:MAG: acyltransferase, partial [Chitinophagaceae bacterium]